jgi:uncharacterized repeat protein (TIGR01451 family)
MQVSSSPEITIEKTDSVDPVEAEQELTYHVWVNNSATANANATDVVITEMYDANVTFIDASPMPSSGTTIWDIPRVNVSESKHIVIRVHVESVKNGTTLLNTVHVTCSDGVEDTAQENTTVVSRPNISIIKQVSPATVEKQGHLVYTIRVNNTGTAPATDVVVSETYDPHVRFSTASPMPNNTANTTWNLDVLPAGDQFTITVHADVLSGAQEGDTLHNRVDVTCDEGLSDRAWANATVSAQPPDTHKVFHGVVHNVTYFQGHGEYVLHFITANTTITLDATDFPQDGASGINHTYYRVYKWMKSTGTWRMLFNWQEYGVWNPHPPYDPIDLASLGAAYGYNPCGKYEIEFYSVDMAGTTEVVEWNDVYVDCDVPQSQVHALPSRWHGTTLNVTAAAQDDGGVASVTLYYRYSEDNASWGSWLPYGTATDTYAWSFGSPNGTGYYQFYSVAEDYVGHREPLPMEGTTPDATCWIVHDPWDVNGDGSVNVSDVLLVLDHWGETPSSPGWDAAVDVNQDDVINISDVIVILDHWTG